MKQKKRCIVHIGMPKTGSSALQDSLFEKIADARVSYANLPVANHSKIIFNLFATTPENSVYHTKKNIVKHEIALQNEKNKALLLEGFANNASTIEIISGEDIIHIDEEGLARMKEFLESYFEEVIIVGYVRSPKSFMESAFQQLVKYHELDNFDFSRIFPKYKKKLAKFDRVFGRGNVKLWKFDPKSFPSSDITLDFCHKLGIAVGSEYQTLRSNDALSREAVALLYANNKYGKHFQSPNLELKVNRALVDKVSAIGSTKLRFSNTLVDALIEENKGNIDWIEKRLDTSLGEASEPHEDDVKSEHDLLTFSSGTLKELQELLPGKVFQGGLQTSAEVAVEMMHTLKMALADEIRQGRG